MSDAADAIRSLRLEQAWSQEELGAIAGISARTVQRLEQGQRPSLETLKALAAAFDVPVSRLAPEHNVSSSEGLAMTPDATPQTDARRRFLRHLATYAAVIGGLAALNVIRAPQHLWVVYPALGWGVPLAWRAWRLWRTNSAA